MTDISAVRMPNFIPSDPALWFTMVETTFQTATPQPITVSKTKFNHCVPLLPPEISTKVRDVIISPDLREEVISRCGESKTQEIRRLLAGEQLQDRQPSELLRIMQRRAENHNVADTLLLELFLQQLPSNVQSLLASIDPLTPSKAAEIADKVMEISPHVSAVHVPTTSADSVLSELLKEMKLLRKEVGQLRRSRSNSRYRPQHQSRAPSPAASKDTPICWYHRKFASDATKCVQPCTYHQGNQSGQQ